MEGRLVEVDGHKMNVYEEGAGEHTLLIMAGSGIVSPVYEYRTLYRRLSGEYRIVVVEKFGYGYSDIVDTERAFDIIIREYSALIRRNFCNITIWNETLHVAEVRDEIRSRPKPSIPMLMFVSDGGGTGDSKEVWRGFAYSYAKGLENIRIIEVNADHALHNKEYVLMADEIKDFIRNSF